MEVHVEYMRKKGKEVSPVSYTLVVFTYFEHLIAGTFIFIWCLTVKELLHSCRKLQIWLATSGKLNF